MLSSSELDPSYSANSWGGTSLQFLRYAAVRKPNLERVCLDNYGGTFECTKAGSPSLRLAVYILLTPVSIEGTGARDVVAKVERQVVKLT